jgi:hypothetical protein
VIGAWTLHGGIEPDEIPEQPYAREVVELVGLLPQPYRLTFWLHLGGWSQVRIAAGQGLSQGGVSLRLARVRDWLRLCAPIRASLPHAHTQIPGDAAVWDAVVWLHEPLWRVAARTGWSQRALWGRWSRLKREADGLPPVVGTMSWAVPGPCSCAIQGSMGSKSTQK